MNKLLFFCSFLIFFLSASAQVDKSDVLKNLEKNQAAGPNSTATATIKTATRLFADKNDLTSVITVIPAGATVKILGWDETYLRVVFEESEGYIYSSHAEINKARVTLPASKQERQVQKETPVRQQQTGDRLTYLEKKYGTRIGGRVNEGKIWKGMSAEMVKDSWGSPQKINRVISGNIIKEEWYYRNTWLYIQNNVLAEWGPVK